MESLELNKPDTLDEIVFENRNKSYGAYLLRKFYDRNALIAFGASSYLFISFLLIPLVNELMKEEEELPPPPKKKIELAIIDVPLDPKTPPPPPLPPVEPPKIKTVKFVPPEIVKDEEADEPPPTQKELEKETASDKDREGEENPEGELPPDVDTGKLGGLGHIEEDQIWTGGVEKPAAFPDGGFEGFVKFINNRLSNRLRAMLQEREVKGRMFVTMTVGKDGTVTDIKLMKGMPNCKLCDEEIPEIMKEMPKWIPAEYNGRPVKVRINVPVLF